MKVRVGIVTTILNMSELTINADDHIDSVSPTRLQARIGSAHLITSEAHALYVGDQPVYGTPSPKNIG